MGPSLELAALRLKLNHVRSDLAYYLGDAAMGGAQHMEKIAACRAEARELEKEIKEARGNRVGVSLVR